MFQGCAEYSRLFVGGASKPGQKGEAVFGVFDFDKKTGDLELITEFDAGPNSTSFCYSEKNKLIYVLNEVMDFKGLAGGGLTSLKFDPGKVTFEKKSEIVVPYGGPCHLSMSPDGGFIFVANYTTGSVAVVKLDDEGIPALISDTIRYDKEGNARPRAHMIKADPAGKHVFVTDLGLNRVNIYDFDKASGSLRQDTKKTIMIPKGYGPRHFVFNADGSKLYLINEYAGKVLLFSVDETEGLKLEQTIPTVREGFSGTNACATIHISSDGKFLYGSNRGENTIVTYNIGSDGFLSLAGHVSSGGDFPWDFTLDPSGRFLIVGNQRSNVLSVFKIDRKTGLPTEPSTQFKILAPTCVRFY